MTLTLDIDGTTQYATMYADGKPVATFVRRRTYENGPAWRAVDCDGKLVRAFYLSLSAEAMAKIVAKRLGIA